MSEPGLDQAPLAFVEDELLDDLVKLLTRAGGRLGLIDPGPAAHHLGQRPIRDAVAVGQTSALMPADDPLDPVGVLEELPQHARLADAGVSDHRHEPGPAVLGGGLEGLDDRLQVVVAADERWLQPGAPPPAAGAGDDPQRGPGVNRLLPALDEVLAGVLVRDRGLARPTGHVVDEHGSRLGDRLQPRRRVDRVAEHHPLPLGAELDRGAAGEHAGPDAQVRHPHLLAEQGHRLGQRERGADRPLGVVLAGHGRSPNGHHGVADELLDGPAVALDQGPAAVEVMAQKLADLLGIAVLAQRGEPDQVGEQHGHQPSLGHRRRRGGRRHRRRGRALERSPALKTETRAGHDRRPTRGACLLDGSGAVDTEPSDRRRQLAADSTGDLVGRVHAATVDSARPTRSSQGVARRPSKIDRASPSRAAASSSLPSARRTSACSSRT